MRIWNDRYEAPHEIGSITVTDFIQFSVSDKEGNTLKDQALSITIEPIDNQKPIVEIMQPVKVSLVLRINIHEIIFYTNKNRCYHNK